MMYIPVIKYKNYPNEMNVRSCILLTIESIIMKNWHLFNVVFKWLSEDVAFMVKGNSKILFQEMYLF